MLIADFVDSAFSILAGLFMVYISYKQEEKKKLLRICGLVVIIIGLILFISKLLSYG